jgi:hypothetical protein
MPPLTPKQRIVTEHALSAATAVGLYAGLGLSLEEFRARRCSDLIDISEMECPIDEGFDDLVLLNFLIAMRTGLEESGFADPIVVVSEMCTKFDGEFPTWGVWCDLIASFL